MAVQRLLATERLRQDPTDFEALSILADIEKKTKVWAESKITPGQFTGQQKLSGLTKEDHKTGIQAWARKNMFRDLAPVMSGFGIKMLRKMGWNEGQALGKDGVGCLEPISLDVKTNRQGLSTPSDKKKVGAELKMAVTPYSSSSVPGSSHLMIAPLMKAADAKSAHLVQGKHPVSALQEITSKKRWDNPVYKMIASGGPGHMMTFLYEVTIPIGTFRSANASKNKKQAKMEAAAAALQGLGLIERK